LEKRIPAGETDISDTMAMLKDSVKRADKIINSLLDFSKVSDLELRAEDINFILDTSLNLLKSRLKFENINVVTETKKDIPCVLADRNKLEQVFVNLLLNAVQAMPSGGKIIIRSYDKKLGETGNGTGRRKEDNFQPGEDAIIVEIEDTGSGISEENLKKIFDPFFTTKGPSGGVGLGLSVTHSIIATHKGLVDVKSQIGKGTKFIVILHEVKE
jgi:two-component system NtrC family sensor kinase